MAALMRHGVFKTVRFATTKNDVAASFAGFATKAEKKKGLDKKKPPKVYSSAKSIAAKGFLRPQRPYQPPKDIDAKLEQIFQKFAPHGGAIDSLQQKFDLFTACAQQLDHTIPNSLLHTIETLEDVRKFYQTPVETITPLDRLKNMELPENLHVQYEPHRFHPETDTMFGGQTAFNRRSTIVTGLKYKGKYQGHVQNDSWPYNS